MFGLESEIEAECVLQTSHYQNARDEQHHRESHLDGDQKIASVQPAKFFRGRVVLDGSSQAHASRLHCRYQAEQERARERDSGCKKEHARVHYNAGDGQGVDGRTPHVYQSSKPSSQQNSRRAARKGKQQALRKKLADELATARA